MATAETRKGEPVRPAGSDVANFSELSIREKQSARTPQKKSKPNRALVRPRPNLPVPKHAQRKPERATAFSAPTVAANSIAEENTVAESSGLPTPPATASFPALEDNGTAFSPETQGAVGPNHLMVALNSQVRIQNRSGGTISTVSLDSFWASLGASNVFDPRLLYDPYGQRWIFTAQADPGGPNPLLLLAVSADSDPTGNWYRRSVDLDRTEPLFADAPNVGFTRDWITVQADVFDKDLAEFQRSELYVFNKADLYANGTLPYFYFSIIDGSSAHVPAATYSPTQSTNYLITVWNENDSTSGFGYLNIYTMGGPLSGPSLVDEQVFPVADPWSYTSGTNIAFLPQLNSTRKILPGDSRLANVVFRNGTIWTAHTVFLPADNPTRAAVQWWEFGPLAGFQQNGLVESTTFFYAFPSISVNRNNGALLGYSRFASNHYPGAAYSYRSDNPDDPLNLMRPDTLLKAGQAPYNTTNSSGFVLWGQWSATTVDPDNDTDLWTIQEYAALPSGGSSRWGTWWGRVTPPVDVGVSITESPDPVLAGSTLTYTLTVTNHRVARVDAVVVTNTLPSGVNFVSVTSSQGSCNQAGGVVACDIGRLEDSARATVTITVMAVTAGQVTNTARVAARGPDITPANNNALAVTTVSPSADLGVMVSDSPDPVAVGSNLTYLVVVTNAGPSTGTGVVVTNAMPFSATFVSATPSVGTFSRTNNLVIWVIGNLAVGASPTMSILVRPNGAAQITNRVFLRATSTDLVPGNNSDVELTRVNAPPTQQTTPARSIGEDTSLSANFGVSDLETPPGSLIVTASSSNEALIPNANVVVTYVGGTNWNVTVTPLPDTFGSSTITRTVTDADGASSTSSYLVSVVAVNDPPTLNPITGFPAQLNEDPGAQMVGLSGIGPGAFNENQALTVTATSSDAAIIPNQPANLSVSYSQGSSTGTVNFTPLANAHGPVTITVTVNDGGLSNNIVTRSFNVNINPVNDPPTIDAIANLNINEDANTTVALRGLSGGPANESQAITITATSSNPNFIPDPAVVYSGGATGLLTITPVSNVSGSSLITVNVNDNAGSNNLTVRTFTVTVAAVNDPPTLNSNVNLTIAEDAGLQTVPLSGINSGAPDESQILTVMATTTNAALLGNLTVDYQSPNSTGTLTFVPVSNANGSGSITITVRDDGTSNNVISRTFNVTVTAVNDPPTLDPIGDLNNVPEDAGQQTVVLTGISAGAPNESAQTVTITALSSDTSIIPHPAVAYTNGNATGALRFTPVANAFGDAVITVTANDGQGGSSSIVRTFTVRVLSVNDAPTLSAIGNRTINEDTTTNITFQVGDVETAPGNLNVVGSSSNEQVVPNSAIIVNNLGGGNRSVSITPALNQIGSATITLTATDSDGGSTNQTFTLTVSAVNDPPTIDPIGSFNVDEDSGARSVLVTGLSGGPANESQSITLSVVSSNTAVIPTPMIVNHGNGTATLSFTPNGNANGDVPITVTVRDDGTSNNTTRATFIVTVNSINDPPIIGDIPNRTLAEDTALTLSFRIDDVETPPGNLMLSRESSNEELISNDDITFGGSGTNRTVTIRPLTNQFGSAAITITVTDNNGASASTFFEVTFDSVNDAPTITAIPNVATKEGIPTPPIPFTIGDVETLVSDLTVSASSSNPGLVPDSNIALNGNGPNWTVTLTPIPEQFGVATITIRVSDGELTRSNSFVLTVNSEPTISSIANRVINEDTPVTIPFTVSDPETPAGSLLLGVTSSNTGLVSTAGNNVTFGGSGNNRTVTIRPLTNQFGTTLMTITVTDGQGFTAAAGLELTVTSVNDLPVILNLSNQSTSEESPVPVSFQVSDVETPAASLIVGGHSSNLALVPNANLSFGGGGSSRTVTVTPAPNLAGTSIITVFVADSDGGIGSNTFVLTVTGANDPPTISLLPNLAIDEDSPTGPLSLTVGDAETPAASLTMSGSASVASLIGSITFGGSGVNRTATISPAANQSGTTMITLNVSDGANTTSTSFQLTINAVNDPPTLLPVSTVTVNEDSGQQTVTLRGLTGGPANESQNLTIVPTTSNPGLISNLSVNYIPGNTNAPLFFTPVANANGTGTVTVTVMDGPPPNNVVSQTFTVIVNALNDPPGISTVANRATLEDVPITVPFTIRDPDTAPWDLTMTGTSSNPGLIANTNIFFDGNDTNRTVTIVPTRNLSGVSTITLAVNDGTTTVNTNFTLTVTATNDRPTLDPIADVIRVVGNFNATVNLTGITTGATNETQTLTVMQSSTNPSLITSPSVSYISPASSGTFTFRVPNNTIGSATVTVTVSDGQSSFSRTFGVYVRASGNSPPTLSAITNRTTLEDMPINVPFVVTDATTPQNLLTIVGRSSNQDLVPDGNLSITGTTSSRTLTITPLANASGTSTITVYANDTESGSTNRSFTLTVSAVNDRPSISTINNISIPEDSPSQPLAFMVSDAETPAAALIVTATSANQAVVPNANIDLGGSGTNRSVVIIPAANQTGSANITVVVNDGTTTTSTNFTVTVTGVNDPPSVTVTDQTMNEDTVGAVPFGVSDADTAAPNLNVTATSSNPALVPDSGLQVIGAGTSRTLMITPLPNQFGTATIFMAIADDSGGSSTDSFLLTVNPVNDPPTLDALSNVTFSRVAASQTVNLTGIGSGAPNENQTLMVAASSSNPGLVPHPTITYTSPNGAGSLMLTAAGISNGTATITVTVNDGQAQNNIVTQTFVVTVNALPTISNIPAQSTRQDTATAPIPFTVGDAETAAGSLMVRGVSSNPSLVPDENILPGGNGANRTVTITPAQNRSGSATIQILVTDGNGAVSSTSFLLVVASPDGQGDTPVLQIAGAGNGMVVVSWPASFGQFSLQSSPAAGPLAAWTSESAVPYLVGNRYYVTNAATGFVKFYRLVEGISLTITRSGNNLVIAWPFPSTGYILESRDAFSPSSDWAPAGGTPVQIGDQNTLTVNASGQAKFYRLRRL